MNACTFTSLTSPRSEAPGITAFTDRTPARRAREQDPSDVKRVARQTRFEGRTVTSPARPQAAITSRQTGTRKHHVKYRMQNRAVYEIRERLAGCAHDRPIHSPPFIAFCLKLGTLRSDRVPWYPIHRDCRSMYRVSRNCRAISRW